MGTRCLYQRPYKAIPARAGTKRASGARRTGAKRRCGPLGAKSRRSSVMASGMPARNFGRFKALTLFEQWRIEALVRDELQALTGVESHAEARRQLQCP